jgi:hypothetical protein
MNDGAKKNSSADPVYSANSTMTAFIADFRRGKID